jgi:hypothetical protein
MSVRNPRSLWLPPAIAASIAVLLCGAEIAGIIALNRVTSRSVASIGGCPSNAFPIRPGSQIHEFSDITVGKTTGCWATYDQPSSASENDVFAYYLDPSNTAGWTRQEAYSNTGFAAFTNNRDSQIQANIGISTFRSFLVAGPATVRLDIGICRCDPLSMAQ